MTILKYNKSGNSRILLLVIMLLFLSGFASAKKDITLSVNQSEYYFPLGSEANINLIADNSYGKEILGTFTYTITQELNQQGMSYSSSNSNTQAYSMKDKEQNINLGFGKSDQPITLRVSLSFDYNEGKDNLIVDLNDILIHFASEESSQQQNKNEKKESSSRKVESDEQNQQGEEQKSFSQKMQEAMDQMFNSENQDQQEQQSPQDRVQNNQMMQDSSALKEQLKQEMEKQKKTEEEFKQNLAKNEDFKKAEQKLLDQDYQKKSEVYNAKNESTGDFNNAYEKDGETVNLKGNMENNELKNLDKTISQSIDKIMDALSNDPKFQKYKQELLKDGFTQEAAKKETVGNNTKITVPFKNSGNETAKINAQIDNNNQVKEVTLLKDKKKHPFLWIFLIGLIILSAGFYLYIRFYKPKMQKEPIAEPKEIKIDFKKESLKLLEEAKRLFKGKKEKNAYGKAAEAIRFYFSQKLGLRKELTNSDLVKELKKHKIEYENTQKCLNLTSLVEFAKYKTNKKDFDEIINLAERIIKEKETKRKLNS